MGAIEDARARVRNGGGAAAAVAASGGENRQKYYGVPDNYTSGALPPFTGKAPQYTTASNADRAILRGMSREKLADLQAALREVGLIDKAGYKSGFVDEPTREAFVKLLGFANQEGSTWESALVTYAGSPQAGTEAGEQSQRKIASSQTQLNTYRQTDPARIRLTAESAFTEALGRKPKPAELARFVKKFQDAEMSEQGTAFAAEDRVRSGNLAREQAGYDAEFAARQPAVDGEAMTGEQELDARVAAMMADAPGKVGFTSRKRTRAQQQVLYDRYRAGKGNLAAKPGSSKHETGEANDLSYQDEKTRQWVLDNADRYGLVFPVRGENWHVEVARGQKAQFGPKAGVRVGSKPLPKNAPNPVSAGPSGDGLMAQAPLSESVSVTNADLGAQAVEYARNVNPVETQAYDIGQQFNNFVGLLQKGVV